VHVDGVATLVPLEELLPQRAQRQLAPRQEQEGNLGHAVAVRRAPHLGRHGRPPEQLLVGHVALHEIARLNQAHQPHLPVRCWRRRWRLQGQRRWWRRRRYWRRRRRWRRRSSGRQRWHEREVEIWKPCVGGHAQNEPQGEDEKDRHHAEQLPAYVRHPDDIRVVHGLAGRQHDEWVIETEALQQRCVSI
jgi:hypothetical protein